MADAAYDSDRLRKAIADKGAVAVIPNNPSRARKYLAPLLGAVHRKSPWVTMPFIDSGYQGDEAQRAAYEASRISVTVVKRTDTQVKGCAGSRRKVSAPPEFRVGSQLRKI
jgi:hypothetical protein